VVGGGRWDSTGRNDSSPALFPTPSILSTSPGHPCEGSLLFALFNFSTFQLFNFSFFFSYRQIFPQQKVGFTGMCASILSSQPGSPFVATSFWFFFQVLPVRTLVPVSRCCPFARSYMRGKV